MKYPPNGDVLRKVARDTDTAATITLTVAADADEWHVLDFLQWSTNATPTTVPVITITCGSTVTSFSVTAGGPGFIPYFQGGGFHGEKGDSMVITMTTAGAGILMELTAIYR